MTPRIRLAAATLLCALLASGAADAHTGLAVVGFASGLAHPFVGLDHLLALVAAGLWAGQRDDRGRWLVPLAFIAAMGVGAIAALAGVSLPGVEVGILASVLLLGALVVAGPRLPVWCAVALTAAFALPHGHAHGAEMPVEATAVAYAAGFLLASGFLLGCGAAAARALLARTPWAIRAVSGAVAAAGVFLAVG